MTLAQAHARAARLSRKWDDGAYIVDTGAALEVFEFYEWSGYGFTESETLAVYEGGERVA